MKKRVRPHPSVALIADHAFRHGVFITEVLNRANVAHSTWTRLRTGANPMMSTIDRLRTALDDLIAEDDGPLAAATAEDEKGTPHGP